jgi:signal transduction histidine kinase/ligand-binding sensor domain-containing protein/DNA-binding response OmpR family regulator
MKKKYTLVVSIILLCFTNIFGQQLTTFKYITTENGLSQNDVNDIYQDKDGFMWFGTHDGLNKYDGYRFTTYKPLPDNENSIVSNLIWKITEDNFDNLWIATTGHGLSSFNQKTEKFTNYVHDPKDPKSISSNHITNVYVDSKNRLWVLTKNGIDYGQLNPNTNEIEFKHYLFSKTLFFSNYNIKFVSCVFEDSNKQIWFGCNNGTFKLSHNKNGENYFEFLSKEYKISFFDVRVITEDSYGQILFGTTQGLFMKKHGIRKLLRLNFYHMNNIKTDNHKIWSGSNEGIHCYNNSNINKPPSEEKLFIQHTTSLESAPTRRVVASLFIDTTGIVWAGIKGGGVLKFDPEQKRFKLVQRTFTNNLFNNNIRSIYEDSSDRLWLGTFGGSLFYTDKNNYQKFTKIATTLRPVAMKEVSIGNKKKLFFGGESNIGLFSLDLPEEGQIDPSTLKMNSEITACIFSVLQDDSNNIWIGTYNGGLFRWMATDNPNEFKKDRLSYNKNIQNSISSDIIRCIFEDKKGNLWFGTGNGLCVLSKEESKLNNPKFTIYQHVVNDTTSLSNSYVLNITQDSNDDIWIGTFGGGINKFIPSNNSTKKGSFIKYSEIDGLPNNVIKCIIEDNENNLWISSNKGLTKFSTKDKTFKNYDVNDGLQSNEFGELSGIKRNNGEILFGGINGLNIFNASEIIDNKISAESVITQFSIFNKTIETGQEFNGRVILKNSINKTKQIELKYKENSFSFEFSALHYAANSKNKFKYKLEGFDNDWISTSSKMRFATYTNLEPGSYNLMVKTSNNDGVWDKTPASLKIIVKPPFWRTNIAKSIYILLFIGGLFLFRRFTIISSTKKHQMELEHYEKEKYEEIHKLKFEFFTNISHEFRTPLTLIKGPLEHLQKNINNLNIETVKEQYSLIHKNVDYLQRLINQLLDFRKMDKGKMELCVGHRNIAKFVKEIGEPFQFMSFNKKIDFRLESSKQNLLSWFDPDAVEKITNNLLSNAFKFTPEGGKITVEIVDGQEFEAPEGLKTKIDKANYVVLQVSDSGPGIPAHKIKFIFDRFYTERNLRVTETKGTGIGLAFIKNLVQLHLGSIDVTSKTDEGTIFTVWLPKTKDAYEEHENISFSDEAENNTFLSQSDAEVHAIGVLDDIVEQNLSKTRSKLPVVLVVDDNTEIRSFIKLGLGKNYDVYEAENGERGFEFAKKIMPNIIITDVVMPIVDGIEFCEKIKSTPATSHIPVIMLTAKISEEWEKEGLKIGADAYIRKPFDMELLELKLQNILKFRGEMRKKFNRDISLQPKEITVTSADETFMKKAIEIVEKHMMNTEFSVELLVKEMALSRSNLHFKIKELTGLSSSEFIRNIRLKRAMQLLEKSDLSVKEIMYMTGFNTASYFSKCFKKQFGVIPSKYVREKKEKDSFDKE